MIRIHIFLEAGWTIILYHMANGFTLKLEIGLANQDTLNSI